MKTLTKELINALNPYTEEDLTATLKIAERIKYTPQDVAEAINELREQNSYLLNSQLQNQLTEHIKNEAHDLIIENKHLSYLHLLKISEYDEEVFSNPEEEYPLFLEQLTKLPQNLQQNEYITYLMEELTKAI